MSFIYSNDLQRSLTPESRFKLEAAMRAEFEPFTGSKNELSRLRELESLYRNLVFQKTKSFIKSKFPISKLKTQILK